MPSARVHYPAPNAVSFNEMDIADCGIIQDSVYDGYVVIKMNEDMVTGFPPEGVIAASCYWTNLGSISHKVRLLPKGTKIEITM